jgi:hypothetical protein
MAVSTLHSAERGNRRHRVRPTTSFVEKSPSLTMSPRVKQYLGTLLYALGEERHFALVEGLRVSNLGSL